ncbi:MAG: hypothetical protein QNJ70_12410 [Xenococcaceae cyanobacterium MO_207.B15]|nr:hypothetical protein [Xenococcaceae cyanobacterium MO_207.B15]
MSRVKGYRREWGTPRCYLSFAPGQENDAQKLINDLQDAGIYMIDQAPQIQSNDYVILLDTPDYQRLWNQPTPAFEVDKNLVQARFNTSKLISLKLEDSRGAVVIHDLSNCVIGDFCDATHYPVNLFNLVLNLYSIPLTHPAFFPLRQSLHRQWLEAFGKPEKDRVTDMEEQVSEEIFSSSRGINKIINVLGDYVEQYQDRRPHQGRKMTKKQKNKNNAWINGSFYLVVFVVVMTTFAVIGKSVPAVILPLVIIGSLLAIGIIGAYQLRHDDSLSQKNFLTLILETYKRLPLLRRNNQKKNGDQ